MNYSMTNYRLELNSSFDSLRVLNAGSMTLHTSFSLAGAYSVSCSGGNYVIDEASASGFVAEFDPENEGDSVDFPANQARMGCITDLRIECKISTYTYYLDECPVVLLADSGKLKVHSPCSGSCTAPNEECCEIVDSDNPECP